VGDMIDVRLVETDEGAGSIVFEYSQGVDSSDRGRRGHEKDRGRSHAGAPRGRQKMRTRSRR
jgi:hypothetical protein